MFGNKIQSKCSGNEFLLNFWAGSIIGKRTRKCHFSTLDTCLSFSIDNYYKGLWISEHLERVVKKTKLGRKYLDNLRPKSSICVIISMGKGVAILIETRLIIEIVGWIL